MKFLLVNHHRWVLKHFPSDFFFRYIFYVFLFFQKLEFKDDKVIEVILLW